MSLCRFCKAEFDFNQDHEQIAFLFSDGTGYVCCKKCVSQYKKLRKIESEEHRKHLRAQWYQDHKKEVLEKQRQRRKYDAAKDKEWKSAHREQINERVRERKQNDTVFKLKSQARNTIYQSFARTGNVKSKRCEDITGLAIGDLYTYLVGTYKDNYGTEWDGSDPVHIDHIIPLATAKTEEDVIRLCHYTNLQLLTAKDNLKKGSAYANC